MRCVILFLFTPIVFVGSHHPFQRDGIHGASAGGERNTVAETHVPSSHQLGTNIDDICIVKLTTKVYTIYLQLASILCLI